MGKGYNNYMCKKPFHPGSKANIKRAWMAEQKTENDKKKQEELKTQYEKEQDLYNNRALISSESKDKLELNFMYEAPPGAKRERQKEDDEPEYKFEWQRKYNAPREDYAKGNADIKDQPFGIPVRNVRCIKCHNWGHINTDRECPLFSQASTSSMPTTSMDPMELMRQMREDGYGLKEHVLGHHMNPKAANQQFIPSDESDPEVEFLKSLSTEQKKKLLRKLKKLSKKQAKSSHDKKKKSKKIHKSKANESDSEDTKRKKKKHRKSSNSSSDSSSDESPKPEKDVKEKKKTTTTVHIKEEKTKSLKANNEDSKTSEEPKHRQERSQANSNKMHVQKHAKNEHVKSDKEWHYTNSANESLPSKKDTEEVKRKSKTVSSNYKSSYSSNSSEDEEQYSKAKKALKHKPERDLSKGECSKRNKIEKCDSDKDEGKDNKVKHPHPDGFSHICPQAVIKANYLPSGEEYKGETHDKFRHINRDYRSPSVKHKYNK